MNLYYLTLFVVLYIGVATIFYRKYLPVAWDRASFVMLVNGLFCYLVLRQRLSLRESGLDPNFFSYLLLTILITGVTGLILRGYILHVQPIWEELSKMPSFVGFDAGLRWEKVLACLFVGSVFTLYNDGNLLMFLGVFLFALSIVSLIESLKALLEKRNRDMAQDTDQARLKIVELLESGKITPEECVELLKAVKCKGSNADQMTDQETSSQRKCEV